MQDTIGCQELPSESALRGTRRGSIGALALLKQVLRLHRFHSFNRMGYNFRLRQSAFERAVCLLFALFCVMAAPLHAQQQEPEDPEDEKQFGLWLDQVVSTPLASNRSIETEFYERFDEGASNLFEWFLQGGVAFRPRPWLTLVPMYRYARYPGNPTTGYENRLLFNITLSTARGRWRYNLRTLVEGRFPENREAFARFRFRPGVDYTLPLKTTWRPVIVVNNEFFIVPWTNPYANGGSDYTQNRFQAGVRFPVTATFSVRTYYMLQSVNLPPGWDTNEIIGISLAYRVPRKVK